MARLFRTIIVIGFALVIAFAAIYFTSQAVLGGSFAALEKQGMERDLGRALDALEYNLTQLNSKTGDWAAWDDSYEFVQDSNAEFIKTNLTDVALVQLRINIILFLKPDGAMVLGKTVDLENKSDAPLPARLAAILADKRVLDTLLQNQRTDSFLTGILLLPQAPLLFAARPIVTSEGTGPIQGTLVFARYLDDAEISELARTTHLSLTFFRLAQPTLPADIRAATLNLSDANPLLVQVNGEDSVNGYVRIKDLLGNPILLLRVDAPRDLYHQGQAGIRFFMLIVIVIGIVAAVTARVLLERLVLSRQELSESEERYRAVIEQAAEGIFLYDGETLRVVEANAAFRRMLGYDAPETPVLTLRDIFALDPTTLAELHSRIAREKIARMGEQVVRRSDGTTLFAEASASVITYGGRQVICAVVHDISERKRAQDELERLFEQEQSRRQELDALYSLSRALADTADSAAMLNLVTFHAVNRIHTTFARILLIEDGTFVLASAYPIRAMGQGFEVGARVRLSAIPICERLLAEKDVSILHHMDAALSAAEREALALDLAHSLCAVPLRVEERVVGLLTLGEARKPAREQFTPEKISLARSIADQAASALRRAELFAELERTYLQTVLALARAVDAKDTYTANHADRLAEMALSVAGAMGISGRAVEDLRFGAILHDIGKIGVADAILLKPARLDDAEWVKMRQHPEIGSKILAPVPRLAGAAKIVRHHHERWDGKGYPDGLAGEAIPLGARILTVVDSFSAITDKRVYKPSRPVSDALTELRKNAGTQFDPRVVEVFSELIASGQLCVDSP